MQFSFGNEKKYTKYYINRSKPCCIFNLWPPIFDSTINTNKLEYIFKAKNKMDSFFSFKKSR